MTLRKLLLGGTVLRAPDNDGGGGDQDFNDEDLDALLDPEPDEQDPDPDDLGDVDPAGDQGGAGDPDQQGRQQQRQPTRYERDLASARARAQQAEADLARERSERLAHQARQQQGADAAERERRLAAMSPEERLVHEIRESELRVNARLDREKFENEDVRDRDDFERACRDNKNVAAVKTEVERILADMRGRGINVSRMIIADQQIGQRIRERGQRARPKAERDAAAARTRETVRAPAGRSDARGGDGRKGGSPADEARKRLDGVKI